MAQAIIRDVKDLRPTAWVYWQVVEPDAPEFGWGLINANYVDTHDQPSTDKTPFVRINRKFFVYGQFTRYMRPGYHILSIADPNSIAAYDPVSHRLVIVKVTGDAAETARFDLSHFAGVGDAVQVIATTTLPATAAPDWKQIEESLKVEKDGPQKQVTAHLYPKSVYTFVIEGVSR
jgi:galactan endo-1,6-beta-galactosidase